MNQSPTISLIGSLLGPAIVITFLYSYIPQDLSLVRTVLSMVQFVLMIGVVVVVLRSILRDF